MGTIKTILKSFFCSTSDVSKFRPSYFWATVLMVLLVSAVLQQLSKPTDGLTGLIGVLAGLVGIILGTYNQGRRVRRDDDRGQQPPAG